MSPALATHLSTWPTSPNLLLPSKSSTEPTPTWSFAFRAALMYGNIWNIGDGKEPRPTPLTVSTTSTPPVTQADADARDAQIVDWDRREQKGQALLALVVKSSIYQSVNVSNTPTVSVQASMPGSISGPILPPPLT